MDDANALSQISVGILTWHRPSTLQYALKSYRRTGILDAVGEIILFANASHPRELSLAREFGLRVLSSPSNIGIGPAFSELAKAATHPNFMFLENDWPCIEPSEVALGRLARGVRLLEGGSADVVRFRHRSRYGHPLYSKAQCEGHELESANQAFLLDAVHWRSDPQADFPDAISRKRIGGEDWFFANAKNASYTNNPSLYRTAFARDEIGPRGIVPGIASEGQLQSWWQSLPLIVAQGPGLFKHHDPGKEWRRVWAMLSNRLHLTSRWQGIKPN